MRARMGIVAILCVSACLLTVANAQTNKEYMDILHAYYTVRASESVCGFKMTEEQRREAVAVSQYFEVMLGLSTEKAGEMYRQVVQSMEAQKAAGLCDPNGELAQVFKQSVETLGKSDAAPSGSSPPAASPPAGPTKLTGLEAWNAVKGNTITGRRNGLDYADYYAPDGRVVSLDGEDVEVGSWKLKGSLVCTHSPSEGDACYKIDVAGDVATFIDEDGVGFRGTIVKGNPKNL